MHANATNRNTLVSIELIISKMKHSAQAAECGIPHLHESERTKKPTSENLTFLEQLA